MGDVVDKIGKLKNHFGVKTDEELALKLSISVNTVRSWKQRKAIPAEYELLIVQNAPYTNASNTINIPMIEAYAGCGSAAGFSEMLVNGGDSLTIDPRIFPSDFLHPHLAAIRIAGDSMEPTLRGGDIAFVQTKNGNSIVEVGDVYLIAYDGGVYIKRLHFQGRKVKIISDNPIYDPFWYEHGDSQIEFDIIGKVVAVLRFGTPLLFK